MRPIFRGAMFGFHKKDVADFVAKQNDQFEKRIRDLQTQLDQNEARFEREREELCADAEQFALLQKKSAELEEKLAILSDGLSTLLALYGDLSEQTVALEKMTEKHAEEMAVCKEYLARSDKLRDKAHKFDRLAGVLGEVISGKPGGDFDSAESFADVAVPELSFDLTEYLAVQRKLLDESRKVLSSVSEQVSEIRDKE